MVPRKSRKLAFFLVLSGVTELVEQLEKAKDLFLVIVGKITLKTSNSEMDSSEFHDFFFLVRVTSVKSERD